MLILKKVREIIAADPDLQGFVREDEDHAAAMNRKDIEFLGLEYVLTSKEGRIPELMDEPTKLRIWVKGKQKGLIGSPVKGMSVAIGKRGQEARRDEACTYAFGCKWNELPDRLSSFEAKPGPFEISSDKGEGAIEFVRYLVDLWRHQEQGRQAGMGMIERPSTRR